MIAPLFKRRRRHQVEQDRQHPSRRIPAADAPLRRFMSSSLRSDASKLFLTGETRPARRPTDALSRIGIVLRKIKITK